MDEIGTLHRLIELAESLGVEVRKAPPGGSDHPGGALVRLGSRQMLFLDPDAPVPDQIVVAVDALRSRPELEEQFLPPDLRERLENPEDPSQ
jgi:hypothetical protein